MISFFRRNAFFVILSGYAVAGVLTILFFNGTGDDGDSVMHYLFARWAPVHPELYLNHWAKPVFVLLSSPFAQYGFPGMKFFNLCVSLLTLYLAFLTARALGMRNKLLVLVYMAFTPLYYILTFSGLTELLFALFLTGAVYLAIRKAGIAAALVVSLMPFVRSEGILVMMVFGLYFLTSKQWKHLPWLFTGHLVFAVAGYFVYHDLLWVFNRIPYISHGQKYGSGELMHFAYQLFYVIGAPLYLLLIAGLLSYPLQFFRKKIAVSREELLLIVLTIFIFILAHSFFWYFGIFNSMGLKRVLVAIVPLICLVALRGFNCIMDELPYHDKYFKPVTGGLLILAVTIFPFTGNPAAIHWNREMTLTPAQDMAKNVAVYVRENPVKKGARIFYLLPYLSVTLNLDPFNAHYREDLNQATLKTIATGDLVIWDNWFAVMEGQVTLESLMQTPGLKREIDFFTRANDQDTKMVIFRKHQ